MINGIRKRTLICTIALILVGGLVSTGCLRGDKQGVENAGDRGLTGSIEIDGSSTVYPITEAVAEEFQVLFPRVVVTVGVSGTGGGFKRFVKGELDINDASRSIKEAEQQQAQANNVAWQEIPVAFDGITVVVNNQNNWADSITVEELKRVWEPESKISRWNQIRPEWPDAPIKLYGPGTDSGTFEYFTEAVMGKAKASRSDYTASEDDNILIQGVEGDKYALGYFGFAYYVENQGKLKAVKVDGGKGPVEPSYQTIKDGSYQPLSRPVYIYVNRQSLERKEVREFVRYYLMQGHELVPQVGYVALPDSQYKQQLDSLEGK